MDRNLGRGLFLGAIALAFGLSSLQYHLGNLSRAGPGLFPLMISGLLLLIAVVMIIKSRLVNRPEPTDFQLKNISLLIGALCAFAVVSKVVNMTAGIAALVFIAGVAGSAKYSWQRNLKIAVCLIAVAFAFQKLLGLNLPLL